MLKSAEVRLGEEETWGLSNINKVFYQVVEIKGSMKNNIARDF